jgi:hypothetical protein
VQRAPRNGEDAEIPRTSLVHHPCCCVLRWVGGRLMVCVSENSQRLTRFDVLLSPSLFPWLCACLSQTPGCACAWGCVRRPSSSLSPLFVCFGCVKTNKEEKDQAERGSTAQVTGAEDAVRRRQKLFSFTSRARGQKGFVVVREEESRM